MLTVEKIIDRLYKLNKEAFIFKCVGTDKDFVKTYINFKKFQLSLQNKKNASGRYRAESDIELRKRRNEFSKNIMYLKINY